MFLQVKSVHIFCLALQSIQPMFSIKPSFSVCHSTKTWSCVNILYLVDVSDCLNSLFNRKVTECIIIICFIIHAVLHHIMKCIFYYILFYVLLYFLFDIIYRYMTVWSFFKNFIDIKYSQTFRIKSDKILIFFVIKCYVKASVNAKLYKTGSTNAKGQKFLKLLFSFKSIGIKMGHFFFFARKLFAFWNTQFFHCSSSFLLTYLYVSDASDTSFISYKDL